MQKIIIRTRGGTHDGTVNAFNGKVCGINGDEWQTVGKCCTFQVKENALKARNGKLRVVGSIRIISMMHHGGIEAATANTGSMSKELFLQHSQVIYSYGWTRLEMVSAWIQEFDPRYWKRLAACTT